MAPDDRRDPPAPSEPVPGPDGRVTPSDGCARCGFHFVLTAHTADGRWERLCQEHGYAGSWVTSSDRAERLARYRARGMPAGALAAGAMFMIKRHRDWPGRSAPTQQTVGLSRSDGAWWIVALGGEDAPDHVWVGSASDSVLTAVLADVSLVGTATRMVAVDRSDAEALLVLLAGSTNPALSDEQHRRLVIEVDMGEVTRSVSCSLTELVERVVAVDANVDGRRLLRDPVCERALAAAYTARLAVSGRTRITSRGRLDRHAPTLEVSR